MFSDVLVYLNCLFPFVHIGNWFSCFICITKVFVFFVIKQPSLQIRSTDVLIYYSKTNSFGSLMELFIPFVKTFTRVKQAKQNSLLKFCLKTILVTWFSVQRTNQCSYKTTHTDDETRKYLIALLWLFQFFYLLNVSNWKREKILGAISNLSHVA